MRNNRTRKVGICSKGKWLATVNGKATKEYQLWNDMLQRCYSEKKQQKHPAYIGCTVADDFLDFQNFMSWCEKQLGFGVLGYQLDKDILCKTNTVYGPENCVFIPQCLNTFYTQDWRRRQKDLPIGVYWHKNDERYIARVWTDGRQEYIGHFDSPHDGFLAYKARKEAEARRLADKYEGIVDARVTDVLRKWVVNEYD